MISNITWRTQSNDFPPLSCVEPPKAVQRAGSSTISNYKKDKIHGLVDWHLNQAIDALERLSHMHTTSFLCGFTPRAEKGLRRLPCNIMRFIFSETHVFEESLFRRAVPVLSNGWTHQRYTYRYRHGKKNEKTVDVHANYYLYGARRSHVSPSWSRHDDT